MKSSKKLFAATLLFGLFAIFATAREDAKKPLKPYPLDTCVVCGMKLADMGKPYVFEYQSREIKVCDKGEAADFKKAPATFLKKIEAAEAKAGPKK